MKAKGKKDDKLIGLKSNESSTWNVDILDYPILYPLHIASSSKRQIISKRSCEVIEAIEAGKRQERAYGWV